MPLFVTAIITQVIAFLDTGKLFRGVLSMLPQCCPKLQVEHVEIYGRRTLLFL